MFPEQLCLCPLYREPAYLVSRLKTFRLHLLRTGHWNWVLKSLRSRTLLHPAFVYPHLLHALQEPVHSPFLPGYMHRIILPVRFRRLSAPCASVSVPVGTGAYIGFALQTFTFFGRFFFCNPASFFTDSSNV